MRINKLRIRAAAVVLGGGVLAAMAAFGGGTADAATTCSASNGHQIERTVGHGGCGAKAGPGSTAFAEDSSDAGTAVAVADKGGNSTARNLQPGSTALAGASTGGTAFSVTTGPKAFSVAQARQGGTTVAIGGWGGQAVAGPDGTMCQGGFATAFDSTTGKACLRSGTIDLRN
ncbi:DUF6764 family protein [Gordonia sp. Z-3]|jgi:hypothetical protein|uniref:Protein kinase n=2 Tax=Gordonia TaxID=2053 RepID=A0A9X3D1G9_9ACTN|nr:MULTISPECIES: DUF6764 family protein [Gordonia]MAU81766.1 hypothetical protein [Gordonia sp. (in: high G+C Gram-positive bacteria)]MCF3939197.1 hypothetical protein [Gordonia tangerina]MCX2963279.1 hypothetical protein [Gordonia aquimaris]MED5800476.1 DUF6764 family protein [Gordonia sp. Z-3]